MEALLERLLAKEDRGVLAGTPLLEGGIPLSLEQFHAMPIPSRKKVLYVDGGNAPLLKAPHFQYEKLRVATLSMQGTKRLTQHVKNYDLIVHFDGKKYFFETAPATFLNGLTLAKDDPYLDVGGTKNNLERLPGLARRLLELATAKEQAPLHEITVMDGSLEAVATLEIPFLKELGKHAVVGVMKTTTAKTSTGLGLTTALQTLAQQHAWWYYPLTKTPLHTLVVKFHEKSPYVFRVDSTCDPELAVAALRESTSDAVFLGYPYPLVLVDKLAKISHEEAKLHRTKLLARHGTKLKNSLSALDAHERLDTL